MEDRQFAMKLLAEGVSVAHAARTVGVSRQTIHKWKKRLAAEGPAGLQDRSHAPLEHPDAVTPEIERLVVKFRRRYREGPRKLRKYLLEAHADKRIPAASTIGRILAKRGMVELRPRNRRHVRTLPSPLVEPREPNDVWCIDFKGEFDVGGRLCYPFTVTDGFSRFAITTRAQTGTASKPVAECLWRAFRRYGLPNTIRSDNGVPFVAVNAPRGLSRVSVLWIRLGIGIERIEPGKPYQNGRHERFHKSLKDRTARPPADTFAAQQKRFDRFRIHYNQHRPHEALEMQSPAAVYRPSPRPCPDHVPAIEHPGVQRIVNVSSEGRIHFRAGELHISKALIGESVGITEIQDDLYEVTYGPISLAHVSYRAPEPQVLTFR